MASAAAPPLRPSAPGQSRPAFRGIRAGSTLGPRAVARLAVRDPEARARRSLASCGRSRITCLGRASGSSWSGAHPGRRSPGILTPGPTCSAFPSELQPQPHSLFRTKLVAARRPGQRSRVLDATANSFLWAWRGSGVAAPASRGGAHSGPAARGDGLRLASKAPAAPSAARCRLDHEDSHHGADQARTREGR